MKRLILVLAAFIVVAGVILGVLYCASLATLYSPPEVLPVSLNQQSGTYLLSRHGFEYRLFLVDSQLYYGVYGQNFTLGHPQVLYSIQAGDQCFIINGTIRNDCVHKYYFKLGVDVWNADGEKVGPVLV